MIHPRDFAEAVFARGLPSGSITGTLNSAEQERTTGKAAQKSLVKIACMIPGENRRHNPQFKTFSVCVLLASRFRANLVV